MGADILNISPAMLNLIWLGLFILLLVIEIITVGLTTIWFAQGALAALAANVMGADLIIQIIIFLAVSVVLLIFTRRGQRSISTENGSEQIMKERSGRL